jgi:glycosyltransferase involved in cell wall biosynthesis
MSLQTQSMSESGFTIAPPTKVAIVTPVLSHFEVPMFRLAAGLPGLDVRVFHCDANGNAFYDDWYKKVIDWGEDMRAGYPNAYYASPAHLRRALWAWRPQVILENGYAWKGALSVLAGARLRGIPVVHRGLTSPYLNPTTRFARARRVLRNLVLKRFQAHQYGGSYSWEVLDQIGFPSGRCYFVPFSVDSAFFAAAADDEVQTEGIALRRQIGWPHEAPVLLFIGSHNWLKGPDVFLEIAALVQRRTPALKALVAGSGPMTNELKIKAQAMLAPDSWHFAGFVPSKSTVPYYLGCDLALFPSRYDTWSRAVNEAMIARRPCIVSANVGAAGGLVDDGRNGYVVEGLDPSAYAKRIAYHLSLSPEQRRQMGEAARARALEFSYEAHIDDLYRSLAEVVRSESKI